MERHGAATAESQVDPNGRLWLVVAYMYDALPKQAHGFQ